MATIEITRFRLVGDVEDDAEEDFLQADEQVRTGFLYHQTGLLRATTARDSEGEWLTIVLWESDAAADAASQSAETDPATARVTELVDQTTVDRRRYTTLD